MIVEDEVGTKRLEKDVKSLFEQAHEMIEGSSEGAKTWYKVYCYSGNTFGIEKTWGIKEASFAASKYIVIGEHGKELADKVCELLNGLLPEERDEYCHIKACEVLNKRKDVGSMEFNNYFWIVELI